MFLPSVCNKVLLREVWIYYPDNVIITNAILPLKYKITTFHIYLICDLQDIRKYTLHMFHHSFYLTIFFTILLFYETLHMHILPHNHTHICVSLLLRASYAREGASGAG